MITPEPDSPADRALRGLPSGRSLDKRPSCRCADAACGHCRRDHEPGEGACRRCQCRGFI